LFDCVKKRKPLPTTYCWRPIETSRKSSPSDSKQRARTPADVGILDPRPRDVVPGNVGAAASISLVLANTALRRP